MTDMSVETPLLQEAIFVFGGAGLVGTQSLERLRRNGAGAFFCVDVRAPRKVAFFESKSYVLPARVLKLLAGLLRPLSAAGLGLHPERIEKLMVSTNILPGWADENGLPTRERLTQSLTLWKDATKGEFY